MSSMTYFLFFFFKQKTAYEMRISDWSSDVCSSDLLGVVDRSFERCQIVGRGCDGGYILVERSDVGAERICAFSESGCRVSWASGADLRAHGCQLAGRRCRPLGAGYGKRVRADIESGECCGKRSLGGGEVGFRSEEHTSELQSLMRISYAVFCLKKKNKKERRTRRCTNVRQ